MSIFDQFAILAGIVIGLAFLRSLIIRQTLSEPSIHYVAMHLEIENRPLRLTVEIRRPYAQGIVCTYQSEDGENWESLHGDPCSPRRNSILQDMFNRHCTTTK